ncbi:HPr(Ser) kinase/phosphatase [Gracilimonas mengyeensis]|uniref:HPr kinase/phosphorylase n=1 Tax=Gracilimonas mengyeensis TaxID=1302730 RepID=A0A521AWS2_9BACT|nr:HPr(Ser) kinase/phosphatase [Gracilimonas mengyeensis]SMO39277.1 Hpr(Ser) kinase/phosphatase [Gracilimonas mengyeensis]
MPFSPQEPIPRKQTITVAYLVEKLRDRVNLNIEACVAENCSGDRDIVEADLHRPGLALAGYIKLFTYQRIQIIGNTETQFLSNMGKDKQLEAFRNVTKFDIPVIFLTNNNELPSYLLQEAADAGIPVYSTALETTHFMYILRDFLEDQFAFQTMVHGSMVDVYGIGILVAGKSGIGKSEVALDLVERGHRLVADDVVMLTKKNNILMSSATEISKHFMEIRGLGIIDVMSMFGIRGVRYQKRLEVVLELTLWDETREVERTGLDHDSVNILGLDIPLIHLPITPGKNITVIAEVIAMNYLLKHYGYDPAQAFQERIKSNISEKTKGRDMTPKRAIEYFEGDME